MAYTAIDDPSAYFQTTLYTGNAGALTITNGGNSDLQPDLVWLKDRTAANSHRLVDSSRGVQEAIRSNATSAEGTDTGLVTAFNSDGFSHNSTDTAWNGDGDTYVSWQWKANGGTRTTNTESGNDPGGGYQANATAGFSIVDYTGIGATGTMAHGLGAVPDLIIIKNREATDSWAVYHSANTAAPETDYLFLDTTVATADDATFWNDTAPTSSVFTVTTAHNVNADGETYIAYLWTGIQGYSKFGSYIGNGGTAGPFVYTGFKPAYVMVKLSSAVGQWAIADIERGLAPSGEFLFADENGATNAASDNFDFLSNGFKPKAHYAAMNTNGATYIYMALAHQPFVTSGGVPCTAL